MDPAINFQNTTHDPRGVSFKLVDLALRQAFFVLLGYRLHFHRKFEVQHQLFLSRVRACDYGVDTKKFGMVLRFFESRIISEA